MYSCTEKNDNNSSRFNLPKNYYGLSVKNKRDILNKEFLKIIASKNDSSKVNALLKLSNEYYYIEDYKLSVNVSKEICSITKSIGDSLNLGKSFYYVGDCFMGSQKDSAYYYYKESEKIFKKINNNDRLAKVYFNKAYLLYYEGNYVESEIEVIKALSLLRNSKQLKRIYRCYSLQGSNHLELGEYDKAEEYFNLSADILKQMKREGIEKDAYYDYEITNTIDLCTAYDKKGEYKKSIYALNEIVNK